MAEMLDERSEEGWRRRLLHWFLLVAVFFAVFVPTLKYMPFTDGMENFNVLPSMELARDGAWAVPTLWGRPRLEKPPLAEWMSAAGILAGGPLEFSARWISLLLTCCTLIVVYEWTRLLANWRTGLVAAVAVGTSLFFVRFGKRAAYDSPLMFWVALTNLALTWGLFQGKWLRATLVGGIALGGGMMTKGPPVLLHTVVPFGACALASGVWKIRRGERAAGWNLLRKSGGTVLGVTLLSVVALLPWVMALVAKMGGIRELMSVWRVELTLAAEQKESLETPAVAGLVFFWLIAPWTIWLVGAFVVMRRERGRMAATLGYLLVLALLPVAIHSALPPMRDRYLLPMLPAAAVAIALVYADYTKRFARPLTSDRLAVLVHFGMLAGFCVAFPIGLAMGSEPMVSWPVAGLLSAVGVAIVAGGLLLQRRTPAAMVVATLLGMVLFQGAYTVELHQKQEAAREVARQIRSQWPDAVIYSKAIQPPPRSMAIYLEKTIHRIYRFDEIKPGNQRMLLTEEGSADGVAAGGEVVLRFADGKMRWQLAKLP